MSSAITRVQSLKVTDENPPQEDNEGLDFERCAALHNAIVEHGWVASGRPVDDMPRTTWWDRQSDNPHRAATTSKLHPSLIEFLKRAYDMQEDQFNFFQYLTSLQAAPPNLSLSFQFNFNDPDDEYRYFVLYVTDQTHASKPNGLLYDRDTHTCLLALDIVGSSVEEDLPWQRLETTLTVYIEMIESGKVVAFHKDLEDPDDFAFYDVPDPAESGWRPAKYRPNAMLTDPATGYSKKQCPVYPWMCVPSTEADLEDSLNLWAALVEGIHDRMPAGEANVEPEHGLADEQVLNALPTCFATKFFARALRPRFKNIAPGLRVQTTHELLDQPFASSFGQENERGENNIPQILVFRGSGTAIPTSTLWHYPASSIPAGLYLEACDYSCASPWEDAAVLLLPYTVGELGSWARTADERPIESRNDQLYQIGWNPHVAPHSTQLKAILGLWLRNLELGNWEVNNDGVAGGIEKYREADTEEHCMEYVVEIGPGLAI